MNCTDRELDIALYAGGDLPAEQADEMQRHLDACRECRELLALYAANRTALAEAPLDLDEFAIASVRTRVIAELRGRRLRLWPAFAAAAAAVVVTLALGSLWLAQREVATLTYTPAVPAVEPVVVPHAPVARSVRVARHVPKQVKPKVESGPAEPILVKLETDDPNVVIYWITD